MSKKAITTFLLEAFASGKISKRTVYKIAKLLCLRGFNASGAKP